MSVSTTLTMTPQGKKFMQEMMKLAHLQVVVGYQEGQVYDPYQVDRNKGKTNLEVKPLAQIAAENEFGHDNVPSRPFMRQSVDNHRGEIESFMQQQKAVLLAGGTAAQVLKNIGINHKARIQKEIIEGGFAPNAPLTIKLKGSSRPLIDSGQMRQNVQYAIKPR